MKASILGRKDFTVKNYTKKQALPLSFFKTTSRGKSESKYIRTVNRQESEQALHFVYYTIKNHLPGKESATFSVMNNFLVEKRLALLDAVSSEFFGV